MSNQIIFTAIQEIPLVQTGDDLISIISDAIIQQMGELKNNDVIVIAQKVISKAEGRLISLSQVTPGKKAHKIAEISKKDPRFVELILKESKKVLRIKENIIIVEQKNGFICANAGIDHSNVEQNQAEQVLLLPEDPDQSATLIRKGLEKRFNVKVGVLIIDSHGRAWRNGTIGMTIGLSGLPGLVDLRGNEDLFGYRLRVTTIGAADELAAGASLLMGQAAEGTPIVHVRGFPYALRESSMKELIRPQEMDLFR